MYSWLQLRGSAEEVVLTIRVVAIAAANGWRVYVTTSLLIGM